MNTQATLQQLRDLRLEGMACSYESILQLPTHNIPKVKLSKLRFSASLEELSYSNERDLSKEQIAQMADCSFIDRAENIRISGATGAGKSFLACALGIRPV